MKFSPLSWALRAAALLLLSTSGLQAAALNNADLQSITLYEMTSGQLARPILPSQMTRLPSLGAGSYDTTGAAIEYYDLYWSTPDGSYSEFGNCLTIDVVLNVADIGGNIDAVRLLYNGVAEYATGITRVLRGGPWDLSSSDGKAVGAPDSQATSLGATNYGTGDQVVDRMSLTLSFARSFLNTTVPVTEPIVFSGTNTTPLTFGNLTEPGSGAIYSMDLATTGNFSWNNSFLAPEFFGTGSNPPAPPDSQFWMDYTPRQLWDLSFTGSFNGPLGLAFAYDPSLIPAGFTEQDLLMYHYTGTAWEPLQTTVDTEEKILYVQTNSLSPFVVGVPEPSSAILLLSGLILPALRRRR